MEKRGKIDIFFYLQCFKTFYCSFKGVWVQLFYNETSDVIILT